MKKKSGKILVEGLESEPPEEEGPDQEEVEHPYACVESVTLIECKDENQQVISIARVWRKQRKVQPYDLEDMVLFEEAGKFHPMYVTQIAEALAKVERVTAVEVTRASDGKGIVITNRGHNG
jgi:hypothetical protein